MGTMRIDINTAYRIIGAQNSRIRELNNKRFTYEGYEYEIRYEGGFATIVALYRREIGKRNFKYFTCEGCWDCYGAQDALEKLLKCLPA